MTRQSVFAFFSALRRKASSTIGLLLLCALLLAVAGLAALAHGAGAVASTQRLPTSQSGDETPTNSTAATDMPTLTPLPTPTVTVYQGPNYLGVQTDPTSCYPGAVSPYPYLDLSNASKDTPLHWRVTLNDSAYTLYKNPANPITPGWTDFVGFIGPTPAAHPLAVAFTSNIGSWQGNLQPCSVATPTPKPLAVTITCAMAQQAIDGKLCVHTEPQVVVTAVVIYCNGQKEPDAQMANGLIADYSGNVLFDWTPNTTCPGTATATVTGNLGSRHGTASTTFTVKPYNSAPTPTSTP